MPEMGLHAPSAFEDGKKPNDLTKYFLLKPKEKTLGAEVILTGFQDQTHRQIIFIDGYFIDG